MRKPPSDIRYPKKAVASQALGARIAAAALARYMAAPRLCQNCQRPILPKPGCRPGTVRRRDFCSHSCASIVTNRTHPKRRPEGTCEQCSAPTRGGRLFCSDICRRRGSAVHRRVRTLTNAEAVVNYRRSVKARAVAAMGGKCCACGYGRSIRAMHFHHMDPTHKDFHISRQIRAWQRVLQELAKCILVCSNCHCEIHDGLLDASVFPIGPRQDVVTAA